MIDRGAFRAMEFTLDLLRLELAVEPEYPLPNCNSKVDFYLSTAHDKGIIIEVKAPNIIDRITHSLERGFNDLTYNPNGDLVDNVLSKVRLKIVYYQYHSRTLTCRSIFICTWVGNIGPQ